MKLTQKIHNQAQKLLMGLSHTGFFRGGEFSELSGKYFCDCSSYINSLIKLIDPLLYTELLNERERLRACDYFDLAKNKNSSIAYHQSIDKVVVGEILVWKKTNIPKSGDSGHMAIVLSVPEEIAEGRYKLLVSDCSKILHDMDSRVDGGVGSGVLTLLVDAKKCITGYIWSSERAKNKVTDVLCISFSDSKLK
ncbi:hypothetical protein A9Q84_10110 [Halobacteriovorax marinus]|uniref:Peptidase C51 domain-containing protein n=1 Tax=Halobacteriovorax marinus TaxID=97084 RepID=A0A1Y5F717_9BACT|nr:hypothetical protein A9Q84_10110 [Halobacteriovorax marinus]